MRFNNVSPVWVSEYLTEHVRTKSSKRGQHIRKAIYEFFHCLSYICMSVLHNVIQCVINIFRRWITHLDCILEPCLGFSVSIRSV